MPRTRPPKRPAGGLVELAPGITIPTDFTGRNELLTGGVYTMRIVTDPTEREPRVASFTLTFGEPPMIRDLADEQLRRIAAAEVAQAAARDAIANAPWAPKLEAAGDAGDGDAFAAALAERKDWHRSIASDVKERLQGRRGRPERTDESKLEMLAYWEAYGIAAAEEEFGLAERTLRRYIADAKQIRRSQ